MKQKISLFIVLAMVATIMTSCFNSESEVVFDEADLLGLWQEEGTEAFVRFTAEQDDNNEYKYGCEWDEAEDVLESDLIPYGNGWEYFDDRYIGKPLVYCGTVGKLPKSMMPDFLHPNDNGYEVWAQAMMPYVEKFVGKK